MYLPQEETAWTKLDKHLAAKAVQALNEHLRSTHRIKNALTLAGHGETPSDSLAPAKKNSPEQAVHSSELVVEHVDTRPLPFYGQGWLLYRFSCVIDVIPELTGYDRVANLFAVCGSLRDGAIEPTSFGEWTLLDWTSSPLHQLNERINLDFSQLNPEHVREYLVFFCSFLGGGEEVDYAPTPFLLPRATDDFYWQHALQPLEELARTQHLRTFESRGGIEEADAQDLPPSNADTEITSSVATERSAGEEISLASLRRAIIDAFAKLDELNPPVPTIDPARDNLSANDAPDKDVAFHFDGVLVWYRNTLFRTNFSVKKGGEVTMEDDAPVEGADSLPLPRLDIRKARPPLPLLCREKPREEISAEEFLARIRQVLSSDGKVGGEQLRLRGLRVHGEVVDAGIFGGAVLLENIEFAGNVLFDDAIFERSLELLACRFLRRLSTRNTTVRGAFRLDRSHCLGALDISPSFGANLTTRPRPTLDLRGLEAKGGLFADHLTVFGRVRAQWARIGGAMRARGLQVHNRGWQTNDTQAVDFSHATIDGPLDLVGHVPRRGALGEARRSFIGGVAVMQGLRASQADLRGIRVEGYLDLESCNFYGSVNLGVLDFDDDSGEGWRARVGSDLDISRGRADLLELSGCCVSGQLSIIGLRLDNSLFARLNGCFRSKVGGDVTLSGAMVKGDIDFGGAEISQCFIYVTGHCGRLRLGAQPWLQRSSNQLGICHAVTQGVLLTDLKVEAGIDILGLHTRPRRGEPGNDCYIGGGFVALGTHLGGGLRFWHEEAYAQFRMMFAEFGQELDANVIDSAINGICAHIGGKLDLRGISTSGTINLCRCVVDDKIRLENARLGGNLRAWVDNTVTCSAEEFNADHALIVGDADLRGLEVRCDLSACDSRVEGNLLLPTGRKSSHSDRCAHVHGSICLSGMRVVASLVINNGVLVDNKETKTHIVPKTRIDLSRCQIGQLSVLGFEKKPGVAYQFGHRINLLAIQVDDWHFEDNEQVRALLAETAPFDASNYIDVEQRLARIGNKSLANKVYRDMNKRAYREIQTRQGDSDRRRKTEDWFSLKRMWLWVKYQADWWFSGHGTLPYLMAVWLLLSMAPVVYVLSNHQNVEFALVTSVSEQGMAGTPVSSARPYDLENDWNLGKAFGLAFSYAIPFFGGARPEAVRARLNGPFCAPWKAAPPACETVSLPLLQEVSPHGFAMIVSVIQFFLWIFIAANLPTIIRRRS